MLGVGGCHVGMEPVWILTTTSNWSAVTWEQSKLIHSLTSKKPLSLVLPPLSLSIALSLNRLKDDQTPLNYCKTNAKSKNISVGVLVKQ